MVPKDGALRAHRQFRVENPSPDVRLPHRTMPPCGVLGAGAMLVADVSVPITQALNVRFGPIADIASSVQNN